jgi:hypothetical protein
MDSVTETKPAHIGLAKSAGGQANDFKANLGSAGVPRAGPSCADEMGGRDGRAP